jgi:transposase
MRQSHVAGERMFVDYAGTTLEVIDASTGEARTAQLFVAALGASSYTYAEATWTQGLSDWIGSHTRTFAFIGGVTAVVVSDNLRSGITKGLLLRASGPPHLRRDGGPLQYCHCAKWKLQFKSRLASSSPSCATDSSSRSPH